MRKLVLADQDALSPAARKQARTVNVSKVVIHGGQAIVTIKGGKSATLSKSGDKWLLSGAQSSG